VCVRSCCASGARSGWPSSRAPTWASACEDSSWRSPQKVTHLKGPLSESCRPPLPFLNTHVFPWLFTHMCRVNQSVWLGGGSPRSYCCLAGPCEQRRCADVTAGVDSRGPLGGPQRGASQAQLGRPHGLRAAHARRDGSLDRLHWNLSFWWGPKVAART
jgi:hypothetical protein